MEHEYCNVCGFGGAEYDDVSLLHELRGLGTGWRALVVRSGSELRVRPSANVWSAIEYAAHTRDVTALHAFGVEQALTVDEPVFPAVADDLADQVAANYNSED